MSKPLISVIVPVYKAEQYLEQCVNSIIHQTYKNLEIILVDDGSPDKSGEMCDKFAEKDSRIKVIHKENGGQSSARNAALDVMTGDYVGFVDSDDWIEKDMYEALYELAHTHDAQISACGCFLDHKNGKQGYFNLSYPTETETRVYTMIEALEESFVNQRITYSPCDKLYKKEIFENLRMTVGRIYEDMEIIPKCIEKAEKVVYSPTPYYHYILTEESTIRGKFNPKRFAEIDVAKEKAEDYKVRYPLLYPKALLQYQQICMNCIFLSTGVPSCSKRRKELIRELKSYDLNAFSGKDKLKMFFIKHSVPLFVFMMKVKGFLDRA